MELHHLLYYIPYIGLYTPIENSQIQLQYLSNNTNFNTFSKSTLLSYINNSPNVCLITDSTFSIFKIIDTSIHQLISNSNTAPSSPTPKPGSNSRKRQIKEEEMHNSTPVIKKLKPSRAAQRAASRRWYHNNKISL